MTTVIIGKRLYDWDGPGKAGVVTDTHFIRCLWPRLAEPTKIFADGSSGIVVQGPPTPRNVVFPDDTVFPEVSLDAERKAWDVFKSSGKRGFVEASPAQVEAYLQTYEEELANVPVTATKQKCNDSCMFVKEGSTITEVDKAASVKYCDGEITKAELLATPKQTSQMTKK